MNESACSVSPTSRQGSLCCTILYCHYKALLVVCPRLVDAREGKACLQEGVPGLLLKVCLLPWSCSNRGGHAFHLQSRQSAL